MRGINEAGEQLEKIGTVLVYHQGHLVVAILTSHSLETPRQTCKDRVLPVHNSPLQQNGMHVMTATSG